MKKLSILLMFSLFYFAGFSMFTRQGEAHLRSNGDGTSTLLCKVDVKTPCYECPNYPMCSGDKIHVFGIGTFIVVVAIPHPNGELPTEIVLTEESEGSH